MGHSDAKDFTVGTNNKQIPLVFLMQDASQTGWVHTSAKK